MPIKALPESTAIKLKSAQVIHDAVSVVKELVDNSIDAKADNIKIIVSANTLDSIQVTDNGSGISQDDREMVGQRHHTSKIETFEELLSIGGSSLGFRGEALASIAELSGSPLVITTCCSNEKVATRLNLDRGRRVTIAGKGAHPVGTSILVTDLLKPFPVRRKRAEEHFVHATARIKSLLQSYALARPNVRLQLRFSKTGDRRNDWSYAPPKKGNPMRSAALAAFGKPLISKCILKFLNWAHDIEKGDGNSNEEIWTVEALILSPGFDGVAHGDAGQYVAIDGRPMATTRGIGNKIYKTYRKQISTWAGNNEIDPLRSPFMCLKIDCPRGSYDANIEPAKDDLIFRNEEILLEKLNELFLNVYLDESEKVTSKSTEAEEISALASKDDVPLLNQTCRSKTLSRIDNAMKRKLQVDDHSGEEESQRIMLSSVTTPWTIAKLRGGLTGTRICAPMNSGVAQLSAQCYDTNDNYLPTPELSPVGGDPDGDRMQTCGVVADKEVNATYPSQIATNARHGLLDTWTVSLTDRSREHSVEHDTITGANEVSSHSKCVSLRDIPMKSPIYRQRNESGTIRSLSSALPYDLGSHSIGPSWPKGSSFTPINTNSSEENLSSVRRKHSGKLPSYRPPGRGNPNYWSCQETGNFVNFNSSPTALKVPFAAVRPDGVRELRKSIPNDTTPPVKESPSPSQCDIRAFLPNPTIPGQGIIEDGTGMIAVNASPSDYVDKMEDEDHSGGEECSTQKAPSIEICESQDQIISFAIKLSPFQYLNTWEGSISAFMNCSKERVAMWEDRVHGLLREGGGPNVCLNIEDKIRAVEDMAELDV